MTFLKLLVFLLWFFKYHTYRTIPQRIDSMIHWLT